MGQPDYFRSGSVKYGLSNRLLSTLVWSSEERPRHSKEGGTRKEVIHRGMRFSPIPRAPAPHPGLQGRNEFNVSSGSSIVVEQIIELGKNWVRQVCLCLILSSNNLPGWCDSQLNHGVNGAQWGGNGQLIRDVPKQVFLFPHLCSY